MSYAPPPSDDRQAPPPPPGPGPWTINRSALISFVGAFVINVLGIVFGHVALAQIKRTGEKGRGFAIAGLVIGYASVTAVTGVIALVIVGGIAGGVAASNASHPTTSTQASLPRLQSDSMLHADCTVAANAVSSLTSTLTDVAPHILSQEAAAAIDAAQTRFNADTALVTTESLNIENVRVRLSALHDEIEGYLSGDEAYSDPSAVLSTAKALQSDIEDMAEVCR